jgi:hypothetical protein
MSWRVRIVVEEDMEIFSFDTESDADSFITNRLDQSSHFIKDEVTE